MSQSTEVIVQTQSFDTSISLPEHRLNGRRPLMVVAFVGIVALVPVIFFGTPFGGDLTNHLRFALPFYESIRSGTIYAGWLAESNDGLGDPRFRFYPPGLYYLLAGIRALSGDWYVAAIVSLVVLSVIGGLGLYFWSRSFLTPKLSMWAAIFYVVAPYHLNEIYQASMLSEYAACSILPFAFAFAERLCRKRTALDVAGLSTSYALLVLTHAPMTVIGSLSLLVYVLIRVSPKELLRSATALSLSVFLALAASAFFWTTVVAELKWIKGSATEPNPYYDYRVNFLFSPSALTNLNTWFANALGLASLGFLLPALVFAFRFIRDKDNQRLRAPTLLLLFSFFMTTALSRPVWAIVPKLSEIQFPFRWLGITNMVGALVLAASIPVWQERIYTKLRPRHLTVALAFVLSIAFVVFQVVMGADHVSKPRLEIMLRDMRSAVSYKDWLPIWAHDVVHVDKMNAKVEAGERPVTVTSWSPLRRTFHIEAGAADVARVHTYYYPHWIATENGHVLETKPAADGLLLISVPAQATDVELNFREPARVRPIAVASASAWLFIAGLFGFACLPRSKRRATK